jgi:hypothetical protein
MPCHEAAALACWLAAVAGAACGADVQNQPLRFRPAPALDARGRSAETGSDDASPLDRADRALLGLDEEEVLSRMGEPTHRTGDSWIFRHVSGCPGAERTVTVHFRDRRVTSIRGDRPHASCVEATADDP